MGLLEYSANFLNSDFIECASSFGKFSKFYIVNLIYGKTLT